eukprot:6090386-Pyramimonas_sp.AAC.1
MCIRDSPSLVSPMSSPPGRCTYNCVRPILPPSLGGEEEASERSLSVSWRPTRGFVGASEEPQAL